MKEKKKITREELYEKIKEFEREAFDIPTQAITNEIGYAFSDFGLSSVTLAQTFSLGVEWICHRIVKEMEIKR